GHIARCPAHTPDKKPSLSISESSDGKLLLKCHRGCEFQAILAAIPHNSNGNNGARREIAHYNYCDKDGNLLYQCVRFDPKDFRQRRPGDDGNWIWNLSGIKPVLYRKPQLIAADVTKTV